jgi:predicted nucleic acid-binding protein
LSQQLVCDASSLVALLLDTENDGPWAAERLAGTRLAAPNLIRFEVAQAIRRQQRIEGISPDQAAQAHADLVDLRIEEWPYQVLAERAWELRHNLSIYDASYVALAELIGTTLVTVDKRIPRAPGLRCAVATP